MGKIYQEVGLLGANNKYKKLEALFDTGAYHNYIAEEFKDETTIHDLGIVEFGEEQPIIFPSGLDITGRNIKLKLMKINNTIIVNNPKFCLFDMKRCDIIIGARLMQQLNITLNPYEKKIGFP